MTSFNDWILAKISGYLKHKEGCKITLADDDRIVVQDVFGFRYEVSVKLLSRLDNESLMDDDKYVSYERRG